MKYYLSLLATLLFYTLQAQQTDSLKHLVYFDHDQDQLTPQAILELNSFILDNLPQGKQFRLIGHTDNVGSEAYNLDLSQRRVKAVHAHIQALAQAENREDVVIYSTYRGEKEPIQPNATTTQKAKNRRVEVYLLYQTNIVSYRNLSGGEFMRRNPRRNPELIVNKVGVEELDTGSLHSTTKVNGVEFSCNCGWLGGGAGSVQPKVVMTGEQAYQAGLTTSTQDGMPLRSEGMFTIIPCGGGKQSMPSFTVKIPVNSNSTALPQLYDIDAQGNWLLREQDTIKVIEENGQQFYTTTVSNCGWINVDVPEEPNQIEIQPSSRLKVSKMHLVENFPNYNYSLEDNLQSREATVMPASVEIDSRASVYCTILKKNNLETYKFPLTYLNGTRRIRKYPTINRKRVSWITSLFKATETLDYAHYRLTPKDLKQFKPIQVEKVKKNKKEKQQ